MFPDGLANSSGHLGRNYMRHMTTAVNAIMPGKVSFYKGPTQAGLIMDEQYHDPSRGFAGGYFIETSGVEPMRAAIGLPGWGRKVAAQMEQYENMAGVFVTGEDPPQASNRITLHPTEKDENGLPVPVLEYSMHPNSLKMQDHANRKSAEITSLSVVNRYQKSKVSGLVVTIWVSHE